MRRSSDYLRLYLVTDRDLARGRALADVVERVVRAGVTAIRLREKSLGARGFLAEVGQIKELLAGTGVPVIVNDRVDVAIAAGADGVHVGQHDLPAADARRLIGPDMLLGVSVATPEEARAALAAGADYLSVSPVFLTPTKPDALLAVGLEGVATIRGVVGAAPLLAIGGIDARNARAVVLAGSDGVAVVSALMSAPDPGSAAVVLRREVDAGLAQRRSP
ncbi:MAG TPA: thiamine phosphate synthase [Thermoanaerobaculales bacterium]|nr:thiamine phosphate synthase [Thermoanaerobaculales bacterium]